MNRIILLLLSVATLQLFAQPAASGSNAAPGAFSRMGFGARGMGMGNAASAVTAGELTAYYNPALSAFQNENSIQSGYTVLSLGRSLNFLSYTRRFDFYSKTDTVPGARQPRSTAGVSAGIINAGVADIDGRDNQGFSTGKLSTSENQFYLAVANRFSRKLAVGVNVKWYYYKLYTDVSSTSIGFDLGAHYTLNPEWSFAVVISDMNSKYKWDTSQLYGNEGTSTTNNFPLRKRIAAAYMPSALPLLIGAEYESDNVGKKIARLGVEYAAYQGLTLRAGVDALNLAGTDDPAVFSFGFSFRRPFEYFTAGVDYAFITEPWTGTPLHVAGLHFNF